MKNSILALLFSFAVPSSLLSLAHANTSQELSQALSTVPTITAETFQVGKTWVWTYSMDDQVYSTEKYTVLTARPDYVLIEMSTRLPNQTDFVVHHHLAVNPLRCLKAYNNPADFKPWSIVLSYLDNGRWSPVTGLDKTLAFEEKFNCDRNIHRQAQRQTVFTMIPTTAGDSLMFQQRRWKNHETSYFFAEGPEAGVMGFKRMSKPTQKPQYTIRFTQSSTP